MQQYMLKQTSSNGCGTAVAKMYLALKSKSPSALCLGIDDDLDDFLKIKQFLAKTGLNVIGKKVEDYSNFYKIRLPLIIQIKKGDSYHFLLVKRAGWKFYQVNDPGYGHYLMKRQNLVDIFTGYYMYDTSKKVGRISQITNNLTSLMVPRTQLILFIVFHILSLTLLALSLLVFDQITFLPYAITLSAFSFIFYLLNRQQLFKLNSRFDQQLNQHLASKNDHRFLELYKQANALKSDILHPFVRLLTSGLSALMLITILLINDYKMIIPIFVIVVIALALRRSEKKVHYKYLQYEESITLVSRTREDKSSLLSSLKKQSDDFIRQSFNKTVIFDIIIFFLVFIIMIVNEILLLNYLLLYFILFLYLKSTLLIVIDWRKYYARYYDSLNRLDQLMRKT